MSALLQLVLLPVTLLNRGRQAVERVRADIRVVIRAMQLLGDLAEAVRPHVEPTIQRMEEALAALEALRDELTALQEDIEQNLEPIREAWVAAALRFTELSDDLDGFLGPNGPLVAIGDRFDAIDTQLGNIFGLLSGDAATFPAVSPPWSGGDDDGGEDDGTPWPVAAVVEAGEDLANAAVGMGEDVRGAFHL